MVEFCSMRFTRSDRSLFEASNLSSMFKMSQIVGWDDGGFGSEFIFTTDMLDFRGCPTSWRYEPF